MAHDKQSVTPAVRLLKQHKIEFSEHPYNYEERGGTAASARALGVDEHSVVKTLIFEDSDGHPLIVLMHGDMQVSAKNLARHIGAKSVQPCKPEVADKHSGYIVGGTSPFATRKAMPVYLEKTILELPKIYINGGRRGYLLGIAPADVVKVLAPTLVAVGTPG
jgi:Cys-tRNA(Pro) deacylase